MVPAATLPSFVGHERRCLRMSRYTTPASELGRLAIGSGDDMPVTTRAMKRHAPASQASSSRVQAPSSRAAAGSSRRTPARGGGGRQPVRSAGKRRQVDSDDEDPSDDEEDDSSDDDDGDDETRRRRRVQYQVCCVYALTMPGYLAPREMVGEITHWDRISDRTTGRAHQRLTAVATASSIRDEAYHRHVMDAFDIQSDEWAVIMCGRMRERWSSIMHELRMNVQESTRGKDVRDTAISLRRLVTDGIDGILASHWERMTNATKSAYLKLLLDILYEVVIRWDRNPYEGAPGPRPAYASTASNQYNLSTRLIETGNGDGAFVVSVLTKRDRDARLLAPYGRLIRDLYDAVEPRYLIERGGQRTWRVQPSASLAAFVSGLRQLEQGK